MDWARPLVNLWLNIAITVPWSLIPVLVTVVVSPSANAAFYIAWMLTSFLYILPGFPFNGPIRSGGRGSTGNSAEASIHFCACRS